MTEYLVNLYDGRVLSVYADVEYDLLNDEVQDIVIDTIHLLNDINLDAEEYAPTHEELEIIRQELATQASECAE